MFGEVIDEVRRGVVAEPVALEEVRVAEVAHDHGDGAVVDRELGGVGTEAAAEEAVAADDGERAAHCGGTDSAKSASVVTSASVCAR